MHQQLRLVVPLRQPGMVDAIASALSGLTDGPMYAFSMIRSGLSAWAANRCSDQP